MTELDLKKLIDSDNIASQLAALGNDRDCALRCEEIAPKTRQALEATQVFEIAVANGLWGQIDLACDTVTLTMAARGTARSFRSWLSQDRAWDPDSKVVKQLSAKLVEHRLATTEQLKEISDAGIVPQTITADQVSAAMADIRTARRE